MWLLWNTVQAVFTALWSAFWISSALITRGVMLGNTRVALGMARWGWGPGLLWGAHAKLEVTGLDNIVPGRPCIVVANHTSMIDIAVVYAAVPINLRFVLKRELAKVPFIGWYAWGMGMVFVDRGNTERAIESLRRAADKIRSGASVVAFPEGTRSSDGSIKAFKKGVFVLAIEAGVDVIPVSIEGAERVLPRDGFRVRPGVIKVAIGPAIPARGDKVELIRAVRDRIIDMHLAQGGVGGDRADFVA